MDTARSPTTEQKPSKFRWFRPTPARFLFLLLAVEGILLLSEHCRWFPFNEHKGGTVLIAIASVGVFLFMMLLWFLASVIFHWRFQFSLRSLFVLTITVAIPFSWLAVEEKRATEQREVVKEIDRLGGNVYYSYYPNSIPIPPEPMWLQRLLGEEFFVDVIWVELHDTGMTDNGLEHIKALSQLQELRLNNTKVTDKGLEHIKAWTQLQALSLNNTKVTDKGLECLKGLTQLRWVSLAHTKVTDKGLERLRALSQLHTLLLAKTKVTDRGSDNLKTLTQLQQLSLENTEVTDRGLKNLKALAQLRWLSLANTEVTDKGLENLKGLTQLRELYLRNTHVTDKGVEGLRKALPNCKIEH
jgi:hypothetical protein